MGGAGGGGVSGGGEASGGELADARGQPAADLSAAPGLVTPARGQRHTRRVSPPPRAARCPQ